ncbi:hypothetical protein LN042_10345 [Kitasatospora sp. RB6PN24]|uniref:hypothetical protein n=1 Tax=Kitasatospora humi TaxID=2893891 RepID=UPI001E3237F7|nr:hypothetical protein [Kitasatospora humi]MCC9307497.1 hypothetical protein [Kitasatospora humi]
MTLTSDAPQVDGVGADDGSGPGGNARLTRVTGVLLLPLLAVQGWTILSISRLVTVHVFVGLLLLGPACLKIATTGYRFVRYYTGARAYRRQGPPPLLRRLLGPLVAASTVGVFATGLTLALVGHDTGPVPVLLLHKLMFLSWIGVTSLHVLLHLPRLFAVTRRRLAGQAFPVPGAAGRWAVVALALAVGTALAFAGVHLANAWRVG